jgi:hypothetical protein
LIFFVISSSPADHKLCHNPFQHPQINIRNEEFFFWDITPCSPLKITRRFGGNMSPPSSAYYLLHANFLFLSTLKMRGTCSSETSRGLEWTTRRYIPQDRTVRSHRCEELKSKIFIIIMAFLKIGVTDGILEMC